MNKVKVTIRGRHHLDILVTLGWGESLGLSIYQTYGNKYIISML